MLTYSAIFEIELILNELNKLMPADITNTIRSLSAGIDIIKKLAELAKKSQSVELREGILELKEQLLSAKEAVLEIKQELLAYREENIALKNENNENIELKQQLENFQIPNIAVSKGAKKTMAYSAQFSLNGDLDSGNGPALHLGTNASPTEFFIIGAYAHVNNIDTKNRPLRIYSSNSPSLNISIENLPKTSTAKAGTVFASLVIDTTTGQLYMLG
jgi:regulator of replication initiation timing